MTGRAITEGLFEQHDDGTIELVGGYSPTSGRYHFPRLDSCPYTGVHDVEAVTLSSHATLWAWTAVTAAPPGYAGRGPVRLRSGRARARTVARDHAADRTRVPRGSSSGNRCG